MVSTATDWLTRLPAPAGALEPIQRRGREALAQLGLPTRRQEDWRLTDLTRLQGLLTLPLAALDHASAEAASAQNVPGRPENGWRVVLDGHSDPLAGVTLPEGVSELSGSELKQALGHTLARCGSAHHWPVEFNHSLASQVLALRIRGSVPPLEVLVGAAEASLSPTRILLVVEEKAELEILEVFLADSGAAHSHLFEMHLGQEARVRHGVVAQGSGDSALMAHLAVEQEPRSSYELITVSRGWALGRLEPQVVQVDGQASTVLKGLVLTADEQQFATHTTMRFEGEEGELDQLQKTVAAGRSHSIFNGAVNVPRAAQRTNAAQLSRNLLLSDRARIDTKPELEIVADDVRCAHGATVTQLQEEEMFYLRSRGISSARAAALLLRGYCQEVVDGLPPLAQRWPVIDHLLEGLER
ncbi:Fe-S cluster assembly protein SufD [Synechococcus sp. UW105]|uniref:Fe-S cluster assembly protein SufD n=1 Tax=Synechococcus sp. UW105 TaxID=337067 RepID=UPI000E0EA95D|nr:Fe-S cluster assembly protein SufD [Synechococcus sp. UW105]